MRSWTVRKWARSCKGSSGFSISTKRRNTSWAMTPTKVNHIFFPISRHPELPRLIFGGIEQTRDVSPRKKVLSNQQRDTRLREDHESSRTDYRRLLRCAPPNPSHLRASAIFQEFPGRAKRPSDEAIAAKFLQHPDDTREIPERHLHCTCARRRGPWDNATAKEAVA
jgi:hypothetical protein